MIKPHRGRHRNRKMAASQGVHPHQFSRRLLQPLQSLQLMRVIVFLLALAQIQMGKSEVVMKFSYAGMEGFFSTLSCDELRHSFTLPVNEIGINLFIDGMEKQQKIKM